MFRTAASIAVLLASPVAALVGQRHQAAPGDRVRITLRRDGHTVRWPGNVMQIAGDTVLLEPEGGGPPIAIPETGIEQIEISRGLHSDAGRGALVGLGVGAGTGAFLGAAAGANCAGTCESSASGVAAGVLVVGAIFGGIGAVLGAAIGSSSHSERWERATLPRQ